MSDIVQYDPADPIVAGRVTLYRKSVNTPDWSGQPNTLVNPDLSELVAVPMAYWKESSGAVVEMSGAEKTAIDAIVVPVPGVVTVATLPTPTLGSSMVTVIDEAGGVVVAFADGTNWRRTTDRAVVS